MGSGPVERTHTMAVPSNWADLPDEELLNLRLSQLPLKLEGTVVESRIEQLRKELSDRGLNFPFHFYLSDEWFTPDGSVSMAVPFYLAHPRLERLEKAQMLAGGRGADQGGNGTPPPQS